MLEINDVAEHFSALVKEHGNTREALGRGLEETLQEEKFRLLCDIAPISSSDSILDVGCGLGHLCTFLRNVGWEGEYLGVDVTPDMIAVCKEDQPRENWMVGNILELELDKTFDFVFCVSTLQYRPQYLDPKKYAFAMIDKLFSLSSKAIAFDIFTDNVTFHREQNLYLNPVELLAHCYKLTSRLLFKANYRAYQAMLYLYKNTDLDEKNRYKTHEYSRPIIR